MVFTSLHLPIADTNLNVDHAVLQTIRAYWRTLSSRICVSETAKIVKPGCKFTLSYALSLHGRSNSAVYIKLI